MANILCGTLEFLLEHLNSMQNYKAAATNLWIDNLITLSIQHHLE